MIEIGTRELSKRVTRAIRTGPNRLQVSWAGPKSPVKIWALKYLPEPALYRLNGPAP